MRWYSGMVYYHSFAFPISILTNMRLALHTMYHRPRRFTLSPCGSIDNLETDKASEVCSYKKPYLRGSIPQVIPANNVQILSLAASMVRVKSHDFPGHLRSREGSVEARHESYLGASMMSENSGIFPEHDL